MFKKSSKNPQLDLLSSVDQHLDSRRKNDLADPLKWHNTFYREIFLRIDESIFAPLFDPQMGAPNAPINQMVAMMILKEANGMSDEQLFEAFRYHLLFRQALGLLNINDTIPTESTYYKFRAAIAVYNKSYDCDLFAQVFRSITKEQCVSFEVSGKAIRLDSTLIGSNIAFSSRYEIIHTTLRGFYLSLGKDELSKIPVKLALKVSGILEEDAQKKVYRYTGGQIRKALGELGQCIQELLALFKNDQSDNDDDNDNDSYRLLERVFSDQFTLTQPDDRKPTIEPRSPKSR